jgi:DNA mismatch repair protein PMS2|eukprot:COSAG01_NODE_1341_length_10644_cov_6.517728_3_plen_78_part_00
MAANGFEFKVDESAPAGRRLRLQTVPMSKNVTFGTEDVYELISLLTARPGVMCRPSRLRSVLASRACRKVHYCLYRC